MGFYQKFILPHLIDVSLKNKAAKERRSQVVPRASGIVLEVGIGSGLNLPFYSGAVTHLYGVDPSPELLAMARPKLDGLAFSVELLCQPAEQLPLDDRSVDTAVTTWTLCSIAEPGVALCELKRVLKAEGQLLFIEHGFSPDPAVQAWQNRLTPLWKRVAGGCTLNQRIEDLLTSAGFSIADLQTGYLPGPRPMTYTYQGSARVQSHEDAA